MKLNKKAIERIKMAEEDIVKPSLKYAQNIGFRPVKIGVRGEDGWPDVWFIYKHNLSFTIEFKHPDGIESPQQKEIKKMLKTRQWLTFTVRNFYYAKHVLDIMKRHFDRRLAKW